MGSPCSVRDVHDRLQAHLQAQALRLADGPSHLVIRHRRFLPERDFRRLRRCLHGRQRNGHPIHVHVRHAFHGEFRLGSRPEPRTPVHPQVMPHTFSVHVFVEFIYRVSSSTSSSVRYLTAPFVTPQNIPRMNKNNTTVGMKIMRMPAEITFSARVRTDERINRGRHHLQVLARHI